MPSLIIHTEQETPSIDLVLEKTVGKHILFPNSDELLSSPQPPHSLTAEPQDEGMLLDWEEPAFGEWDDYKTYVYNTVTEEIEQEIDGIVLSEAEIFGLTNDVEYEFWVVSVRDDIESEDSNHVLATPVQLQPDPPTNVAVEVVESSPSYKFYRLNILATNGGRYAGVREFTLSETLGGDSIAVTASGTGSAKSISTGDISTVFDGIIETNLNGINGTLDDIPWWVQYQFEEPKSIVEYGVGKYRSDASTSGDAKDWQLLASNDGIEWEILDEQSDVTDWETDKIKKYELSGSGGGKNAIATWDASETEDVDGYNVYLKSPKRNNYSLSFDGIDDYVDLGGNILDGENVFTIEALAYIEDNESDRAIFSAGGTELYITVSGLLAFSIYDGSAFRYGVYEDFDLFNQWVHIAGVYDGSNVKVYLNAVEGGRSDEALDNVFGSNNASAIGRYQGRDSGSDSDYFKGKIDEVKIWNIARSQQDIEDEMFSILEGTEEGIVSLYRFEEGNGGSATDETGTNEGTISGAIYSEDVPPEYTPIFEKQNSELITDLEYTIEDLEDGDYELYVTAVKNDLESEPSNIVEFSVVPALIYDTYRFILIGSQGSASYTVNELYLLDEDGSNLPPTESGEASTYNGNGNLPYVFDGGNNINEYWSSSEDYRYAWIQYKFDSPQNISSFKVIGGNTAFTGARSWALIGSNDGGDWDLLGVAPNVSLDAREVSDAFSLTTNHNEVGLKLQNERIVGTGSSMPCEIPSNVKEGDLIVALVFHRSTLNIPAGWTLIIESDISEFGQKVGAIYKIASSSDAGTDPGITQTGTGRWGTHCQVFSAGKDNEIEIVDTNKALSKSISCAPTAENQLIVSALSNVYTATSGTSNVYPNSVLVDGGTVGGVAGTHDLSIAQNRLTCSITYSRSASEHTINHNHNSNVSGFNSISFVLKVKE